MRTDSNIAKEPALIKKLIEDSVIGFPEAIVEMIKESDISSLILTRLSYRTPLDLMLGRFRKGTVTVAGDAMHVMGPFLGQGSSAAMEDAVVLARCLAQKIHESKIFASESKGIRKKMEEAIDEYVRERRMRLVKLCAQTCLLGLLLGNSSSVVKLLSFSLMVVLFRDPLRHTRYDCGVL